MKQWIFHGDPSADLPTIHIVSDSVGVTGQTVARAAAATFGVYNPSIAVLPSVKNTEMLKRALDNLRERYAEMHPGKRLLLFYTLIDQSLHDVMDEYVLAHQDVIKAWDIMAGPIHAIEQVSGKHASRKPGKFHSVNEFYFQRIEAMEFTIMHDDGRNPQDLSKADIVLIGVSRSSKTPLSIYLSQQGYKVANVPLDFQTEPPKELEEVDSSKLFGLMISPETLVDIRRKRIGKAAHVASKYADLEYVYQDLEDARAYMRRLGAIVIRTDNRAIEETAQEILRYYENVHPQQVRFD